MVTHEMDVIEKVCDHIAVMEAGHVIEQGSTVELFSQPKHPTTQTFIQTVLQQHLPTNILKQLENQHHHSIYRLQFLGKSAQEPVIQSMIKAFDVSLNILFASMTEIDGTVIGQMFVQILGEPSAVEGAIHHLEKYGVSVASQAGEQK